MPEILHRSSLITRSEWTPTFFDLTEDANSSSSPKRLPYCQYRILVSLLLWLCLSSTYPLGGKWRDRKSSPQHPQLEAGHSTSAQASAQQHQPLHSKCGPTAGSEVGLPLPHRIFFLHILETWFRHLRSLCHLDSSLKDEIINARISKFLPNEVRYLTEDN